MELLNFSVKLFYGFWALMFSGLYTYMKLMNFTVKLFHCFWLHLKLLNFTLKLFYSQGAVYVAVVLHNPAILCYIGFNRSCWTSQWSCSIVSRLNLELKLGELSRQVGGDVLHFHLVQDENKWNNQRQWTLSKEHVFILFFVVTHLL
jgi:hypothetical protein